MNLKGAQPFVRVCYYNCPKCLKMLEVKMHKGEARTDRYCEYCKYDLKEHHDRSARRK